MAEPDLSAERTSLGELARLFLRLGATTFGGPAAHIAMMREHVVRRRGWLTDAAFLDLVSATNLIPGPNSTELAIHIGYQRRRWAGLLIAGVAFIAPAMLLTGALAWAYVRYDTVPAVGWFLYGVKPVILAVILQAIAGLAPRAAGTTGLRVLGGAAVLALALGAPELAVLFGAGLAAIIAHRARAPRRPDERVAPSMFAPLLPAAATTTAAASLPSIFGVFAKIGSVLFGSGYVLVAFLRAELVQQRGWLTEGQLVDAVAVGQVTPGPVFTTATFIGYLLAGPSGALVATAGIFLPAFVFVAASGPLVPRAARVTDGRRVPRRRERRVAGADGGGDRPPRRRDADRWPDDRPRAPRRGAAHPLQARRDLVDRHWRGGRVGRAYAGLARAESHRWRRESRVSRPVGA
jgi:chromate transporter